MDRASGSRGSGGGVGRRPARAQGARHGGGGGRYLGGLLAAAVLGAVGSSSVPLELLSPSAYPYAKCMDGTQGGFFYQAALDPASKDKWVVHLQGGGECGTEAECRDRLNSSDASSDYFLPYVNLSWTPDDPIPEPKAYMEGWAKLQAQHRLAGAQPLPDRRDVDPATLEAWLKFGWWALGDTNTSNPHLWGWNHVLVPYCSQDLHSGQRAGPIKVGGMEGVHFAGHWILEAVLGELDRRGLKSADTILLSGHSAGGMGTFLHADWLSERYSAARVLAAPIAGFYFFATVFDGKGATTGTPACGLSDFSRHWVLWAAFVDFSSAFDLNDRPWECMVANASCPYIDTPMFITQAQTDQIVLEAHDCLPPPKHGAWDPDADLFIKDWHKNMSDALHIVFKEKKGWGLFGAACYTHTNFTATHPTIKKYSFLDALHAWMKGATGTKPTGLVLEDDCGEFCNPTCLPPGKHQKLAGSASIRAPRFLSPAHQRLLGLLQGKKAREGGVGHGAGGGGAVVSVGL